MDYNRIIIELLDRVSVLEEKVEKLMRSDRIQQSEPVSVGKKYRFLADYLHSSERSPVHLSFEEIEAVLGDRLPDSAYKHKAFWANTESHSIALSWLSVGYQTTAVNMEEKYVVLEKKRDY